jgi:hypothetical protein
VSCAELVPDVDVLLDDVVDDLRQLATAAGVG